MRLYFSFRGGDRPKNAEREFSEVCVTPKGSYEPWMLFRKPIEAKTVAENLRQWKTGGLRRLSIDKPLPDSIPSGRTPGREEVISNHPCLKPQHYMRVIVRALLPLGKGMVLDPFMGSGSTVAAAEAVGYDSIGIELDKEYFKLAERSIPRLAALYPGFTGGELEMNGEYGSVDHEDGQQLSMVLAEKKVMYRTKASHKTRRH
jgi:site-specific DNA-methyltransferase (adenine-specific)